MTGMDRREFLCRCCALAGAVALAGPLAGCARPVEEAPEAAPITDEEGRPLGPGDLVAAPPALRVAVWQDRPAVVFVLPRLALEGAAERHGYNTGQHAVASPLQRDAVIVAYDGHCKHLGCVVGWNEELGLDYDGDGGADGRVLCPCHQSQYDVHDLGANVPGVPAQHPLDVLSLEWRGEALWARHIPQTKRRDADQEGPGAVFRLAG